MLDLWEMGKLPKKPTLVKADLGMIDIVIPRGAVGETGDKVETLPGACIC
jgi:hypothetical protein